MQQMDAAPVKVEKSILLELPNQSCVPNCILPYSYNRWWEGATTFTFFNCKLQINSKDSKKKVKRFIVGKQATTIARSTLAR